MIIFAMTMIGLLIITVVASCILYGIGLWMMTGRISGPAIFGCVLGGMLMLMLNLVDRFGIPPILAAQAAAAVANAHEGSAP